MVKRALAIRKQVEKSIWQAHKRGGLTKKETRRELAHLQGVWQWALFLARRRKLRLDLAGTMACLHDLGRIELGLKGQRHVLEGCRLAQDLLEEAAVFDTTEIRVIVGALARHSDKGQVCQSAYAELLKDADSLSRYFENPAAPLSKKKKRRLRALAKDLGGGVL